MVVIEVSRKLQPCIDPPMAVALPHAWSPQNMRSMKAINMLSTTLHHRSAQLITPLPDWSRKTCTALNNQPAEAKVNQLESSSPLSRATVAVDPLSRLNDLLPQVAQLSPTSESENALSSNHQSPVSRMSALRKTLHQQCSIPISPCQIDLTQSKSGLNWSAAARCVSFPKSTLISAVANSSQFFGRYESA